MGTCRCPVALVFVLAWLAITPAVVSANGTSSPPLWQPAHLVDHSPPFASSEPMVAVSCPSVSACVAFSDSGHTLSSTDPAGGPTAWKATTIGTRHGMITAGSCASSSLCVATDEAGDVITSVDPMASAPTWTTAKLTSSPYHTLSAVSCSTVSLCFATDREGNVLSSSDPDGGAARWKSVHVDTGTPGFAPGGFAGISCPTVGLCVAISFEGSMFTSTDPPGEPSAWQAAQIQFPPDSSPGLTAVSCP
jgi:hypothetical protein